MKQLMQSMLWLLKQKRLRLSYNNAYCDTHCFYSVNFTHVGMKHDYTLTVVDSWKVS